MRGGPELAVQTIYRYPQIEASRANFACETRIGQLSEGPSMIGDALLGRAEEGSRAESVGHKNDVRYLN